MKKKNILALVAIVLALVMGLSGCGGKEVPDAGLAQQVAALEKENAELKNQIELLTRQLQDLQTAVLQDWSLKALAASDRSYATVTFQGEPASVADGETALLVVNLNGLEAESVPCNFEGGRYTATVDLPAADGYSYYCLLVSPSGLQQSIPLVTAENGMDATLVDLGSSLNAYCNLFVEAWSHKDGKITIDSGFVQAQMPVISAGGDKETAVKAELVLLHNGEEVERQELKLETGEAEGSYEMAVSGASFATPKLEEDHQLDILLVVTLSSGGTVSYNGCSFYVIDGTLNPVMG